MRTPKVYVVQHSPGKNIQPATQFGELVSIFPPEHQVLLDVDHDLDLIATKLAGITEEDHLLLIGDPVAIALVAAVVADQLNGLNLLRWNRQDKVYEAVSAAPLF